MRLERNVVNKLFLISPDEGASDRFGTGDRHLSEDRTNEINGVDVMKRKAGFKTNPAFPLFQMVGRIIIK
jgi:hypothetical protein